MGQQVVMFTLLGLSAHLDELRRIMLPGCVVHYMPETGLTVIVQTGDNVLDNWTDRIAQIVYEMKRILYGDPQASPLTLHISLLMEERQI